MIINLNSIADSNAHAALVRAGHKEYCFIGPHRPDRNLLGSPLHRPFLAPSGAKKGPGPSNVLQYRQWLWSEIRAENPALLTALRQVAVCGKVVHKDTPEIAALVLRAAEWVKKEVLMPQIVCTKCLVYLTDANAGEYHLCAECAWSGSDDDDDSWKVDISHFCGDCNCILTRWISQMYGQCEPCREKEEREARASFNEAEASWIPYRPNFGERERAAKGESPYLSYLDMLWIRGFDT